MGGIPYYQYPHNLVLNQDVTLSNAIPHCNFTFKDSKKYNPYNPTLSEDMTVMHKEKFK